MNKRNKSLIALLLVLCVGLVGLTIAYFSNTDTINNIFTTKEYGSTYTEEFVSPNNWLPGDTTDKTVEVENTGDVDQAVRISYVEEWIPNDSNATLTGWIHADGTKSNHTTEQELATDERAVIINFANTDDWTKVGNYYYYNYKLAPNDKTSSFIESVTFNPLTKLGDTCVETQTATGRTITCNSSGSDYDNATYTLTLTIETVQYNKYATAWNTNIEIGEKPVASATGAQYLLSNATNASDAEYNASTKSNMFVFNHAATAQTPALTDYRYIGDAPNNYVKFNCENDGTNCEIWRIIGVFSVDDGTGNVEQRIKLVRGSAFADDMAWDDDTDVDEEDEDGYYNDWTIATLKTFLNGDYYNRIGDATTYGLKASAKSMIDNAVFYLGAGPDYYIDVNDNQTYGTTEEIYAWERGNTVCAACNSDLSKLTWTGKVALMYPSDEYMVYGNGVDNLCYNYSYYCIYDDDFNIDNEYAHPTTGWVYNSNIKEGQSSPYFTWLLSPNLDSEDGVSLVYRQGWMEIEFSVYESNAVRPVVYLSSDVEIESGTGAELDPYVLKINND